MRRPARAPAPPPAASAARRPSAAAGRAAAGRSGPPRRRRPGALRAVLGTGLLVGLVAGAGAALATLTPPLLQVETPRGDVVDVGLEGVTLLVRFREPARVAASTFRVRLNGADVTRRLEVARNGAHGALHGLLDGENRLELAVFARPWWSAGLWVERRRTLRLRYRRPVDWNRG